MNNAAIEKRILVSFENNTPDLFDSIMKRAQKNEGTAYSITPNKIKKRSIIRPVLYAASLLLIVTAIALLIILIQNSKAGPAVYLDCDHSYTIKLSDSGRIISVSSNTDEGRKIISDLSADDLKKDINTTVRLITDELINRKYISEENNSLLLSIESDDKEKIREIENAIDYEYIYSYPLSISLITQSFEKSESAERKAKNNGVSPAKIILSEKIAKITGNKADSLFSLSVNDLSNIIVSNNLSPAGINISGTPSNSSLIGENSAVKAALDNLKITESDTKKLSCSLGSSQKQLVYVIRVNYKNHSVVYRIDAYTGDIIEMVRFDGSLYVNPKYTTDNSKKSDDQKNAQKENDYIPDSNYQITYTENIQATEAEDRPKEKTADSKDNGENQKSNDNYASQEYDNDIFTKSTCTRKTLPPFEVSIPYPSDSIDYTVISKSEDYFTSSFPYTDKNTEGGQIALICNEQQFIDFFKESSSVYTNSYFENKVLIAFSYNLKAGRDFNVLTITDINDTIYVGTTIKGDLSDQNTFHTVTVLCEADKAQLKDVKAVKTGY